MDNKEIIKLKLTQLLTENENKFLIESVKNQMVTDDRDLSFRVTKLEK